MKNTDSAKKMKIGYSKLTLAVALFVFASHANAAATLIAAAVITVATYATAGAVAAVIVGIVATAVVAKSFAQQMQPGGAEGYGAGSSPNPGNRQQISPATDNKLPVVYGSAWLGGTITDLTISENNQELYYVISLCEVTDNGNDTITFGDVYWGGKRCNFEDSTSPNVISLTDTSTNETDASVNGKLRIYLYPNGSNSTPARGSESAITLLQTPGLVYTWDSYKLMTNCAFAILHISYNQNAGLTGMQQTKFQVNNSRYKPGDCFYDYFTSTVYGAAVDASQVDTASLATLNAYSDQSFTYTDYDGNTTTQTRFRFDGVVDTKRAIMDNLQDMSSCCDCLVRYNEIQSKWGVVTQKPTYTIAMALDDSNMVSSIQITPLDIAGTYNIIECKFPDESNQDSFNTATFDLAQIDPALLFPNEPVNKQSLSLALVNNDVRAQYLANRMLKSSREDLQVQVQINYSGIQLESGDIVTITSSNYGWVAKEFRIMKVTENFAGDGSITANLVLVEFNATIYDDVNITQFQPAPNTGIANPLVFGNVPAPVVGASYPTNANPLFLVNITASVQGIIQYAEIWYSAFSTPTVDQLIFAGTTEIQSNGTPYDPGSALPAVTLANIPAGTWYLFSRMVNSLGTSPYSPASSPFVWKPTTFQYSNRYLVVAYANNATGTSGFSSDPRNKLYYGLYNSTNTDFSSTPSNYTWYLADPTFGTNIYLAYTNRTGRKFSFATGFAGYAAGTGAFIPTQATIFDPRIWAALPDATNAIDLDMATGQVIQTGTTTVGTGEIAVTNNPDGKVVASLKQYLDFGSGVYSKTTSAALLTIDIYGRVVGFETPDAFYMTIQSFTATSGQTVFSVTRSAGYISGQCLVYENGLLQSTSDYTDTGGSTGTVTFATGRTSGDIITIISFKSVSSLNLATTAASGTGSTATLTFATRSIAPFTVGQSITVSGVTPSGYNGTYTVTACTTSSVSFASSTTGSQTVSGTIIPTNAVYPSFTRNTATLTNTSSYTPSGYTITSGYELLFLNGSSMTEQDYDIVGGDIVNMPSIASGELDVIQWSPNNLTTPNGNPVNLLTNTIIGQSSYSFNFTSGALNIYMNGVLYLLGTDYTTTGGGYILTNTPTNNSDLILQQTFARTGAV